MKVDLLSILCNIFRTAEHVAAFFSQREKKIREIRHTSCFILAYCF